MKRARVASLLLTITIFSLLIAAPALGQGPAVPVEPPADTSTALDWTYRYLIPTGLLIAVVVVVMTTIRYFTNVVRKRYRIVEE
jgi:uncharacterized BrkB/YihY/UPF0761 family membrane protein